MLRLKTAVSTNLQYIYGVIIPNTVLYYIAYILKNITEVFDTSIDALSAESYLKKPGQLYPLVKIKPGTPEFCQIVTEEK